MRKTVFITVVIMIGFLMTSCASRRIYTNQSRVKVQPSITTSKPQIENKENIGVPEVEKDHLSGSTPHESPIIQLVNHKPVIDTTNCDHIVLKDGTQIEAVVVRITNSQIEYRKCNHQDGPLYVLETSRVSQINYKNGDRHVPQSSDWRTEPVIKPTRQAPQNVAPTGAGVNIVSFVLSIIADVLVTILWLVWANLPLAVIAGMIALAALISGISGSGKKLWGLGTAGAIIGGICFILAIIGIILLVI